MNHPKLTKALAALEDARTKVADVLEAYPGHVDLKSEFDLINRAILVMPHVQVPNA